jgi:hypothetical protein
MSEWVISHFSFLARLIVQQNLCCFLDDDDATESLLSSESAD